jgi:NAD+ synthase
MEQKIIAWIKEYALDNKIKSLVVGISGGIDSALVSVLCALTGLHVNVVSIPIEQNNDQLDRAKKHAQWLLQAHKNVEFIEKDLTAVFRDFKALFDSKHQTDLALANSKSRLRMVALYQIAASSQGIVVGTGNKVEDFGVGFFTKYGDGGVDISPIADLTKSEVRALAKKLGINDEIISAKPTDGLWNDDRSDEDQIGATYEELEWAMEFVNTSSDKNKLTKRQMEILQIFHKFNSANKHKMVPVPIFKHVA